MTHPQDSGMGEPEISLGFRHPRSDSFIKWLPAPTTTPAPHENSTLDIVVVVVPVAIFVVLFLTTLVYFFCRPWDVYCCPPRANPNQTGCCDERMMIGIQHFLCRWFFCKPEPVFWGIQNPPSYIWSPPSNAERIAMLKQPEPVKKPARCCGSCCHGDGGGASGGRKPGPAGSASFTTIPRAPNLRPERTGIIRLDERTEHLTRLSGILHQATGESLEHKFVSMPWDEPSPPAEVDTEEQQQDVCPLHPDSACTCLQLHTRDELLDEIRWRLQLAVYGPPKKPKDESCGGNVIAPNPDQGGNVPVRGKPGGNVITVQVEHHNVPGPSTASEEEQQQDAFSPEDDPADASSPFLEGGASSSPPAPGSDAKTPLMSPTEESGASKYSPGESPKKMSPGKRSPDKPPLPSSSTPPQSSQPSPPSSLPAPLSSTSQPSQTPSSQSQIQPGAVESDHSSQASQEEPQAISGAASDSGQGTPSDEAASDKSQKSDSEAKPSSDQKGLGSKQSSTDEGRDSSPSELEFDPDVVQDDNDKKKDVPTKDGDKDKNKKDLPAKDGDSSHKPDSL